jgi:glycosyltransferase involved in cell wall biosynthesis
MRILHIVQSLEPSWGGIARVVPELAAGLARRGLSCRIATLAGGRYGQPPEIPQVDVLTFPAPDRSQLGRSRAFDEVIGRLVSEADVVHLHGLWQGQNWTAGCVARRQDKPYIMTPHSMMMPWAWRRHWWKKRPVGWLFEHRNLRGAARLHALAEGEAEHMRALGFNARIEVIPNGVWPVEYQNPPPLDDFFRLHPHLADRRWLLFLSRLHAQKGVVELLRACFDVVASEPAWHLVLAGPDQSGLGRAIQAALHRKGQTDRVTLVGMLDRRLVPAVLARGDVFVQPSLSEGLSMSILEAMAAARPVLISNACNMPEVAAADAGRVVEPTRHAIAASLRELLEKTPGELSAMGLRGRQLVMERFDWADLLPRYQRLYEGCSTR